MPSKSKKQHNFMEAVAHSPSFAKKVGVPQSVGKDFSTADKGKTFKRGGDMATKKMAAFEKSGKDIEKKGIKEGSKADMAMDKMQMMGMKAGGKTKKMAIGGMTAGAPAAAPMDPRKAAMIAQAMRGRRPGAAAPAASVPGMKKGGSVYTRSADGVASRGKTKATQIKMAMGGSAKKYC